MSRAEQEYQKEFAGWVGNHNNGYLAGWKRVLKLLKLYAQHDTRNDKLGLLEEIRKLDE